MKILQDVHPRKDGLQEAEVCCKFNRSADTITDVLLIPKALAEQERAQARKEEEEDEPYESKETAKVDYAVTPSGRRQIIDEYRSLVLAKSRAPDFFPKLVSRWRPTGKRVHFPEVIIEEEA
jgi:hypothetical protein